MSEKKKAPRKLRGATLTGDDLGRFLAGERMRFPAAGPWPKFDPADPERFAKLAKWSTRDLIFRAVHTNDPERRTYLAQQAQHMLLQGQPLTPAVREWLCWVLVRLIATDKLPHLSRGNAIKSREKLEQMVELASRMMQSPSRKPIGDRLGAAAERMKIGKKKAEALFYSETCQAMIRALAPKKSPPK